MCVCVAEGRGFDVIFAINVAFCEERDCTSLDERKGGFNVD